jgi:hypothetical protein
MLLSGSFSSFAKHPTFGIARLKKIVIEAPKQLTGMVFNVYPNPSGGILNIGFEKPNKGVLRVFDLNGRIVYSIDITPLNNLYTIQTVGFSRGVYFANFISESNSLNTSQKIIVLY